MSGWWRLSWIQGEFYFIFLFFIFYLFSFCSTFTHIYHTRIYFHFSSLFFTLPIFLDYFSICNPATVILWRDVLREAGGSMRDWMRVECPAC